MKQLLILIFTFFTLSVTAEEIVDTINRLPTIREKALSDTENMRAGSRTEMIDAAVTIRNQLLPLIVKLESKLKVKSEAETQTIIERDLEAVARDAHIRGHSKGWGGTMVTLDSAWVVVDHLEARASWCVWQLMKDNETFDFQAWIAQWTKNSE